MSKVPIAVQLFTLRNEAARDFVGTLREVADAGYHGVEFAGYGGLTARDLRQILDDFGLKAAGSHVGFDALRKDIERQLDYNRELGSRYIVCPSLPQSLHRDAAGFRQAAGILDEIGHRCRSAGFTFCYHNHAFEFQTFDGRYGLDILYGGSRPENVQAEIDVYWVKKGGADPVEFIRRYAGRAPLIHLKDMTGDERATFAEVGEGVLDFEAIFAAAEEGGVQWYIVEQDQCARPPVESVKISLNNLRRWGKV
ncbi:MAG TPA: sugar phosphate isomerase/epimerase [Limnochordia bacterium]